MSEKWTQQRPHRHAAVKNRRQKCQGGVIMDVVTADQKIAEDSGATSVMAGARAGRYTG